MTWKVWPKPWELTLQLWIIWIKMFYFICWQVNPRTKVKSKKLQLKESWQTNLEFYLLKVMTNSQWCFVCSISLHLYFVLVKKKIVRKIRLLDITLQDGQRSRLDLDLKEYFWKPPNLKQTRYTGGASKPSLLFQVFKSKSITKKISEIVQQAKSSCMIICISCIYLFF